MSAGASALSRHDAQVVSSAEQGEDAPRLTI